MHLIYTPGKVGSRTVQVVLKQRGWRNVFHEHAHSRAQKYMDICNNDVMVITGVREPLRQSISSFFYGMTKKNSHWYIGPRKCIQLQPVSRLIEIFQQRLPFHLQQTYGVWFEAYQKTTGVTLKDLHSTEYGWEATGKKCRFLFYRMEELDRFLLLAPIGGKASEYDIRKNSANKSWYNSIYSEFQRRLVFSKTEYTNLFRSHPCVNKFYNDDLADSLAHEYLAQSS